jgi:hypothetical protein
MGEAEEGKEVEDSETGDVESSSVCGIVSEGRAAAFVVSSAEAGGGQIKITTKGGSRRLRRVAGTAQDREARIF